MHAYCVVAKFWFFRFFRSITIELGNYIGIVIFDLKDSLQNDTLTNVRQMATI